MRNYTREDILTMAEEEDVEFIRLQFTDIFGTIKNIAVTESQLEKALNNECKFDGSAIEGFTEVEESDLYLYPDLNTFEIFPWRPQRGKVARLCVISAGRTGHRCQRSQVCAEDDCEGKRAGSMNLRQGQV